MNQHRNITMQQLHKEEADLLRQVTEIRKAIEILEGDSQTPARLCPASRADLLKEYLLKHPDGVGVDAGDVTDSPADQATQVGMEKPASAGRWPDGGDGALPRYFFDASSFHGCLLCQHC